MKRKLTHLALSWAVWLAAFAVGKVGFMLYNKTEAITAGDAFDVLRHGFSQDVTTAAYLLVLPWAATFISLIATAYRAEWRTVADVLWRRVMKGYYIVVAPLVALAVCVDTFLYEFWQFKLNATVFAYVTELEGATQSVSMGFAVSRIAVIIVCAAVLTALFLRLIPSRREDARAPKGNLRALAVMMAAAPVLFLAIRGGVGASVQNVGTAYYSQRAFLNHSGVNPVFSLLSSVAHTQNYARQFRFMTDDECTAIVTPLLSPTPTRGDTLLRTERPNILIIEMEGFGARFVEPLGGLPDVAPHINALCNEGVLFTNYYSTSFRTDRGTVSLFSGWTSYPTVSLMKIPEKAQLLPGLARSLAAAGYTTSFVYGGDINFTGTAGYLTAAGFETLMSDGDFPLADSRSSKWGVADAITAQRVGDLIEAASITPQPSTINPQPSPPWLMGYLTLSSHEPWEVPYSRLSDERLNAFAYTDDCIGRLIDRLKASPAWDNLLVVLVPDHSCIYDVKYDDPAYFHSPLLLLGGAIREPRRIDTLMGQNDLCATLLAQLGLPHDDYPWSRDVLSPDYRRPFVYSTSPSTAMYADSTGTTIFDLDSRRVLHSSPADPHSTKREQRLKALLQYTYLQLDAMR